MQYHLKSKVIIKDKLAIWYLQSSAIDNHVVWGATAIMIHEFRSIV